MNLLETVREFLFEMPAMAYVSKNDPYLRMKKSGVDVNAHLASTPIHRTDTDTITKVALAGNSDQYAKIDNNRNPIFRLDTTKTSLSSVPNKVGSKVASMVKFNTEYQYPDVKKVYDHLLINNDFIRTDDIQYPGGKNTWLKLVHDYDSEGKHLYIHENDKLTKVLASHIEANHSKIWNSDKTHVVISNSSL
jgi:hypothetical protein